MLYNLKLGIMQPYFFPYLGYFQLISSVDKFIIHDNVNFIKKGWINRNRLLQSGGGPIFIIVPVVNKSSYCKIRDIKIDRTKEWNKNMIKTIEYNYKKSAYYNDIFPVIERLLRLEMDNISELNYVTIKELCDYLEIDTLIENNISKYNSIESELEYMCIYNRNSENEPIDRTTLRIIKICDKEKADTYINSIGGQELYRKQVFEDNGVDLKFINTLGYDYAQNSSSFYPHLSIIDVLMNCGKEGTQKLLYNYELI